MLAVPTERQQDGRKMLSTENAAETRITDSSGKLFESMLWSFPDPFTEPKVLPKPVIRVSTTVAFHHEKMAVHNTTTIDDQTIVDSARVDSQTIVEALTQAFSTSNTAEASKRMKSIAPKVSDSPSATHPPTVQTTSAAQIAPISTGISKVQTISGPHIAPTSQVAPTIQPASALRILGTSGLSRKHTLNKAKHFFIPSSRSPIVHGQTIVHKIPGDEKEEELDLSRLPKPKVGGRYGIGQEVRNAGGKDDAIPKGW